MTDVQSVVHAAQFAQQMLVDHPRGALALVDRNLLLCPDYWQPGQAETFESIVASTALNDGHRRVVFVTVVIAHPDGSYTTPVGDPTEPEQLFLLALDLDSGLDICRSRIERVDGLPTIGDIEELQGHAQLDLGAPGAVLIRLMGALADV